MSICKMLGKVKEVGKDEYYESPFKLSIHCIKDKRLKGSVRGKDRRDILDSPHRKIK